MAPNKDFGQWHSFVLACVFVFSTVFVFAQDGATGVIRGVVTDPSGGRIESVKVIVKNNATGVERVVLTTNEGVFAVQALLPGDYSVRVEAKGLTPQLRDKLHLDIGGDIDLQFKLSLATAKETITISDDVPLVETQTSSASTVIDERAISDLPLNGRRFSDLALLSPGVTTDPRSLTSSSNGDLAFGGIRGFQSSFLVDGSDNNNAFFAQARGRYRAPYQFSNEVVQEFRVSSNLYGVESGRAGGAVINVATKSGSNHTHGSAFYYLRDNRFNAQHPFTDVKPQDRQHQYGFTLGGPVRRNRVFFFGGFDQHVFHVPTLVRFLNGTSTVVPQAGDYESHDQTLVFAAASELSKMGGEFRSALIGNAAFFKMDFNLTPKHFLSTRFNSSRYSGVNNVFFDPASPITTSAITENGQERVGADSLATSLTSALGYRVTSIVRLQFSRDLQNSTPNSLDVRTKIADVIDGFGRTAILPRQTRERRIHFNDTITVEGKRHSWKFGGDTNLVWIRNFFPMLYGGQYIFDNIRVNQFTFQPQPYGLMLSPLRAYAHQVPRYYIQNFGDAVSHPDTKEYSAFAQDTLRVTDHLAMTLGIRYDLQTFKGRGLVSNPLWPDSGKVPTDTNNIAPRVGFAYSLGEHKPLVFRGGYGIFYTRIPQIYNSAIETENGIANTHLFLDNYDYWDRVLFPQFPSRLVNCPPFSPSCTASTAVAGKLTSEVSAFAHNFQIPRVHQASLGMEREIAYRFALGVSYLFVHGEHLIRARDMNLPKPINLQYPVFDETGTKFLGTYYNVDSFSNWQLTPSVSCPFVPCVNPLSRPIPQLGAIDVFESAASSVYHGLTVSAKRRMTRGLYFRLSYTWAHAIDDGQDALVVGRPATVQNSYSTQSERGSSVVDQRQRFVFSWIAEPRPFHRDHDVLGKLFNDWRFSGVLTFGTGRPVNARITGDANVDGNTSNDRLPGTQRNSFTGPDYATTDVRVARRLYSNHHVKVELLAESFNLLNRTNGRVSTTDDGFLNTAGQFVQMDAAVGGRHYPAQFRKSDEFLRPSNSYAPRQIQLALKMNF